MGTNILDGHALLDLGFAGALNAMISNVTHNVLRADLAQAAQSCVLPTGALDLS